MNQCTVQMLKRFSSSSSRKNIDNNKQTNKKSKVRATASRDNRTLRWNFTSKDSLHVFSNSESVRLSKIQPTFSSLVNPTIECCFVHITFDLLRHFLCCSLFQKRNRFVLGVEIKTDGHPDAN